MKFILKFNSEKGVSLVLVLMTMALLLSLTNAGLLFSGLNLKTTSNYKTRSSAFNIAEAGLNHAWQELSNGDGVNDFPDVYGTDDPMTPTTLMSDTTFGSGSYTVTGQKVTTTLEQRVEVTSTSCIPAASPCPPGNSKAIIRGQFRGKPSYNYAVLTKGNLSLSGGAKTDSFDSGVASYNPSAPGNQGSVRSSTGNVDIQGKNTQVNGDATAGGAVTTQNPSNVTGTSTSGAPPALIPPVNSPCTSYSNGSGITGGVYSSLTGQLVGTAGQAITLTNGTYCLSSVTLSGNSTLTVSGPVTIYVDAHSDMSGGTLANTTGLAKNLQIYSTLVSSTSGVVVTGGSQAYFTVYAPDAKVTVTGNSDLYGAIVGGLFETTGGAKIHYDQALANGGWIVDLLAWQELFE